MSWQLWNSGEEQVLGHKQDSAGSGIHRHFFYIPHVSFFFLFLPLYSVGYCLECSLPSFTSCNWKYREFTEEYPHSRGTDSDKHQSKSIESTEPAETAGGGLWPHCTDCAWNNRTGHEWQVSKWNKVHRWVPGDINNGSDLQIVLEFSCVFYSTVNRKGVQTEMECCFLFHLQLRGQKSDWNLHHWCLKRVVCKLAYFSMSILIVNTHPSTTQSSAMWQNTFWTKDWNEYRVISVSPSVTFLLKLSYCPAPVLKCHLRLFLQQHIHISIFHSSHFLLFKC